MLLAARHSRKHTSRPEKMITTQLTGTPAARGVLLRLRAKLRPWAQRMKDCMGFNAAAVDDW
jgi:hypothetical protein